MTILAPTIPKMSETTATTTSPSSQTQPQDIGTSKYEKQYFVAAEPGLAVPSVVAAEDVQQHTDITMLTQLPNNDIVTPCVAKNKKEDNHIVTFTWFMVQFVAVFSIVMMILCMSSNAWVTVNGLYYNSGTSSIALTPPPFLNTTSAFKNDEYFISFSLSVLCSKYKKNYSYASWSDLTFDKDDQAISKGAFPFLNNALSTFAHRCALTHTLLWLCVGLCIFAMYKIKEKTCSFTKQRYDIGEKCVLCGFTLLYTIPLVFSMVIYTSSVGFLMNVFDMAFPEGHDIVVLWGWCFGVMWSMVGANMLMINLIVSLPHNSKTLEDKKQD